MELQQNHWEQGTLLLLNGQLPPAPQLQSLSARFRRVVAADGAAVAAVENGVTPDAVIGDLDSVGGQRTNLEELGVTVIERPSQEENDFEKSLKWLIEQGETTVTIAGIGGGMIDHTLNNFSIVAKFAHKLQLRFLHEGSVGTVVVGDAPIPAVPGLRVSIIPLPAATITTIGLAWELSNQQLAIGQREGASNMAVANLVSVRVHHGVAAVVVAGDSAERARRANTRD